MTTSVIPRGQHHIEVSSVPDDAAVYRLIVVFFVLCVEDHRLFFTLFFFPVIAQDKRLVESVQVVLCETLLIHRHIP